MAEYRRTYRIENGRIREYVDDTEIVQTLIDANAYVSVTRDNDIQILRMVWANLLENQNFVRTGPIGIFLDRATDRQLDGMKSTDGIPLKSKETRKFATRIETVDPVAHPEYHVDYTSVKNPIQISNPAYRTLLNDLTITSHDHDLSNAIVFVNGVGHQSVHIDSQLYVLDGYLNMRLTGKSQVLLLDTGPVGGSKIIPITRAMVTRYGTDPLRQGFKLTLNEDLLGHWPLLCIGGQLLFPGEEFVETGARQLKVRSNRIDLAWTFLNNPFADQGKRYRGITFTKTADLVATDPLDVSDAPQFFTEAVAGTRGTIRSSDLLSDDTILNVLETVQSFIVLIKTDTLYTKTFPARPQFGTHRRFTYHGVDTPRGLFRYNGTHVFPHVILASDDSQHLVFAEPFESGDASYKSRLDFTGNRLPFPYADSFVMDRRPSGEFRELYRPDL